MSGVYFIAARELGMVKIGFSRDPVARLKQMQTGNSALLTIETVINGNMREERAIHRLFLRHRIRGEWFALVSEIDDFIKDPRFSFVADHGQPKNRSEGLPFARWLSANNVTASAFAARIGCVVSTVTRIARGEVMPRPRLMSAIMRETGGAVQPGDFYGVAAE